MNEPVRKEGTFTFIALDDTGLDPQDIEDEFANDDPNKHTYDLEVIKVPQRIRRKGAEAVDTGVN